MQETKVGAAVWAEAMLRGGLMGWGDFVITGEALSTTSAKKPVEVMELGSF